MSWEQEAGKLLCSGDVRTVSLWDVRKEMKIQVMVKNFRVFYKI